MPRKATKKCKQSLLYSNKKIINYPSYLLKQPAFDLFGDVVVTHDDVFAWVAAVAPRWLTPQRSYTNYVRGYDVPSKVRASKINGTFDDTINNVYIPWHNRLAFDVVL